MAFKSRLKCLFLKPIFCILFATFLHFARNTTPDEDYPKFLYQTGLGCLSGFAIEPHFRRSKVQLQSIEKVKSEKQIPVYGIYEEGGMIIDSSIKCFGKIEKFE